MTPAVKAAQKAKVSFELLEYQHDSANQAFGLEAVEKLNLPAEQVFKTLVTKLDNYKLVVAIVPVTGMLNLKALAKTCNGKKAVMADKSEVERSTGYVLGGVSPLGQKKALMTVLDSTAEQFDTIYVSGGKRGLEIQLSPQDLIKLTRGRTAAIASE
ncbi:Cys-tRNA(Pro) deacylase [Neptunicella marina]|uniref:Cys-tRNA(Pro)/Cys-tRNA(Cys) deacylase n=1 Tax=Neptunicella marina TaxID=2125989 RepID=A0A8J6IXH9_9ALTE|nr:Cys-tRNA(Pro) deacylase [Neptunicella marina]MBC3767038.1 Cys-tRNA(Pro) deacylase [Neptunicella marina]